MKDHILKRQCLYCGETPDYAAMRAWKKTFRGHYVRPIVAYVCESCMSAGAGDMSIFDECEFVRLHPAQ